MRLDLPQSVAEDGTPLKAAVVRPAQVHASWPHDRQKLRQQFHVESCSRALGAPKPSRNQVVVTSRTEANRQASARSLLALQRRPRRDPLHGDFVSHPPAVQRPAPGGIVTHPATWWRAGTASWQPVEIPLGVDVAPTWRYRVTTLWRRTVSATAASRRSGSSCHVTTPPDTGVAAAGS